jgi:hypothetical protein
MSDEEKLLLAILAMLAIKGLIDASNEEDRSRVNAAFRRLREQERGVTKETLFGRIKATLWP